MKSLFGNKKLIKAKLKREKVAQAEERGDLLEYEVKVNYEVTINYTQQISTSVIASSEDDLEEKLLDNIYLKEQSSPYFVENDEEIIINNLEVIKVNTTTELDDKTLDLFSKENTND